MTDQAQPKVDGRGFVTVDGVKIGRLVTGRDGKPCLQFCDKNRHRSHQRGTRLVEVPIQSLQDCAQGTRSIDKTE